MSRESEYITNLKLIPVDYKQPYRDRLANLIKQEADQKVWPQPKVKKDEQN